MCVCVRACASCLVEAPVLSLSMGWSFSSFYAMVFSQFL